MREIDPTSAAPPLQPSCHVSVRGEDAEPRVEAAARRPDDVAPVRGDAGGRRRRGAAAHRAARAGERERDHLEGVPGGGVREGVDGAVEPGLPPGPLRARLRHRGVRARRLDLVALPQGRQRLQLRDDAAAARAGGGRRRRRRRGAAPAPRGRRVGGPVGLRRRVQAAVRRVLRAHRPRPRRRRPLHPRRVERGEQAGGAVPVHQGREDGAARHAGRHARRDAVRRA